MKTRPYESGVEFYKSLNLATSIARKASRPQGVLGYHTDTCFHCGKKADVEVILIRSPADEIGIRHVLGFCQQCYAAINTHSYPFRERGISLSLLKKTEGDA